MPASAPERWEVHAVEPDTQRAVLEHYATSASYCATGRAFDLPEHQVRRICKSPSGAFALEQILRDRQRARAVRLAAITDRALDELEQALKRGNERVLTTRRDGEPLTIFLRPELRDVTYALTWLGEHARGSPSRRVVRTRSLPRLGLARAL